MVFVAQIKTKANVYALPGVLAIEPEKEAIGLYLGVFTTTDQVGMGIAKEHPSNGVSSKALF